MLPGGANHDRGVGQGVEIEGMQRLTVFEHDEIGYVDHVVDRPQADRKEPFA